MNTWIWLLWFKFFPWLFQAWKLPFKNSMTFPGFPWAYEPCFDFSPGAAAAAAAAVTAAAALARPAAPGARPENTNQQLSTTPVGMPNTLWSQTLRSFLKFYAQFKCPHSTATGRGVTWSGCGCENRSACAGLRGGPRWAGSFCRSPRCRRASPEPSSCQSRAWTRSPPRSCGPCGCRRKSPPLPASCSPSGKR